ncbi:WD40-repeat-containing domain protein [Stachybotrys elegans]|uniref:WD40-repeat-containing domain protein n=1 Tax=Stachybotrys elegans TaxID=80388 RepID=A0A8K0WLX2_9HYPO|nr:WD40-repeat-containing domain protein [Stachybotrys elegans]
MIWTTTTGALQGTLKGHTDWVYSVAFSPDSTLVASNARDGTVRIWAAEAGTLTQTLYIGVASSILAFDYQSNSILTDDGAYEVSVPLQQASATNTMPASIPPITRWGIRSDGCWITLCGTKVLWIPKDYRPTALQICEQIIAVGCDNGRVWIAHLENMDSLQDMLLCGT